MRRARPGRFALYLVAVLAVACSWPPDRAGGQAGEAPARKVDFSAAGLEVPEVESFLSALQRAVRADDKHQVAGLVAYPLNVTLAGQRTVIADTDQFEARYTAIVTPAVKTAIETSSVDTLFANSQGVRIGRGEVWFGGVYPKGSNRYVLKILAINVR
jgi:hypothetical protein